MHEGARTGSMRPGTHSSPLNRAVDALPDITLIAARESAAGETNAMPANNVSKTRIVNTLYGRRNIGYGRHT